MHAIHAMWLREVKRYLRSRVQIIASLAQPMMYLLILGFVIVVDLDHFDAFGCVCGRGR